MDTSLENLYVDIMKLKGLNATALGLYIFIAGIRMAYNGGA